MLTRSALLVAVASLVPVSIARTDFSGCTSSAVVVNGGGSLIWYVPDTGEICSFLDCGGGRAPRITTRPGCIGYAGTATVTPSFLPGFASKAGASSTAVAVSTSVVSGQTAPEPTSSSPLSSSPSAVSSASSPSSALASPTQALQSSAPTNGTTSGLPGIISTGGATRATTKPPTSTKTGVATATKPTSSVVTGAAAGIVASGVSGFLGAAAALGAGMAML